MNERIDLQAMVLAQDGVCPGCGKRYAKGDVVSSANGSPPRHTDCSDPRLKKSEPRSGQVPTEEPPMNGSVTEYCEVTKPSGDGFLRCDLPPNHPGDKHVTALMNPFIPGKVAFIHEWFLDQASAEERR